jgi:hypothetical protein
MPPPRGRPATWRRDVFAARVVLPEILKAAGG